MPRTSRRSSQGFTLTELLVVIAIIAVLAAIAFPGFQSMVESSRAATCTTNLRGIFTGIQGYVQDNNGQYPHSRAGKGVDSFWFSQIGPYLNEGSRFQQSKVKTGPWPQNIPFACPSCTKHGWGGAGIDVGINGAQVGGFEAAPVPALRVARVVAPSTTMLVADGKGPDGSGSWQIGSRANPTAPGQLNPDGIATRHKGRANVLYFDGHVGQVTAEQLKDSAFVEKLRGPLFQR
jgi:prepilin-type N-terminal cleavage/methylation domain-containing protein/prepilin-type processing-associated H-X9-DG protein